MKTARSPLRFLRLPALVCGLFLLIANPAKGDSINFFIDFLSTDPTIGTMSGLFREIDGPLDNTIDQSELTSLMVTWSGQADSSSFTLAIPEHNVRYFSYDLPSNVITELGMASGASSAVMNFSGPLPF